VKTPRPFDQEAFRILHAATIAALDEIHRRRNTTALYDALSAWRTAANARARVIRGL
jgi:hypothetical protein